MTAPVAPAPEAPPPSLARFFDAMTRYLWQGAPEEDLFASLGPSPSSSARFAFYRSLVEHNPRRPLAASYQATGRLLDEAEPGLFGRALTAHLEARAEPSCAVALLARGFPATLERLREAGEAIPSAALEVADYEEIRHRVSFLDLGPEVAGGVHPSVEVRSYTFDVPAYARAVREGGPATASGDPVTRILHRHPQTGRLQLLLPTLPMLVAVALASGEAEPSVVEEAGLTPHAVDEARQVLVEKGVIVP